MNYSLEYGKQKDDDFISRLLNTHDEICRKTLESIMDSNLIEGSHKLGTNHEVLYHYCSLNSFFSIINSNCFWLSYPKFMNDLSEYKNSKEIMLKNLEKYKSTGVQNSYSTSIIDEVIELIKDDDKDDLEYQKYPFCISFTSKEDYLPMWFGYTGTNIGISIGFNFSNSDYFFEKRSNLFDPKPRGRFVDLIYDNSKLEKLVRVHMDAVFNYLNSEKVVNKFMISRITHEAANFFRSCTSYFKNSDFEYEKETRFTYRVHKDIKSINFRVKNNFIVPYLEYPPLPVEIHREKLEINRSDYKLPITSIMISPNAEEKDMVLDSIKAYMHLKGYDIQKINFNKSGIQYRPR